MNNSDFIYVTSIDAAEPSPFAVEWEGEDGRAQRRRALTIGREVIATLEAALDGVREQCAKLIGEGKKVFIQ